MRTILLSIYEADATRTRMLLDAAMVPHAVVPSAPAADYPAHVKTAVHKATSAAVADISALRQSAAPPEKSGPAKPPPPPPKAAKKVKGKPAKSKAPKAPRAAKPVPEGAATRESVLAFVTEHPGCLSEDIPGTRGRGNKDAIYALRGEGLIRSVGEKRATRFYLAGAEPETVEHRGQTLVKATRGRGPVKVRKAGTREPLREIPGPVAAE